MKEKTWKNKEKNTDNLKEQEDRNIHEPEETEQKDGSGTPAEITPPPKVENKMGVMPIGRLTFNMALPAIFSMTIHALYNVVDSIFVAQISQQALAAVTLVFPLQMFFISVSVGTGVGVNSLIARRLGARRFEEAGRAASHGLVLALCNWLVFAIIGVFLSRPYVLAFSDAADITGYAIQYCFVILTFSLFAFFSMTIEKIFQATGNMIYPMFIGLAGGITNIVLDPILIFGLLGAPRLEVLGAAVATVIGQFVSFSLALVLLVIKDVQVKIRLKGFRFEKNTLKNIYSVGFPAIVMQSVGSVMLAGLNGILISLSDAALAVLGAYFRLQSFIFMPVFGLNQGSMPIMGYNFGARNKERLTASFKTSLVTAVVIMGLGTVLFQVFPHGLLMLFNASEEMMSIGVGALRAISLCFVPAAFGIICSCLFQAIGHGMLSLWISLLRQLILILPLAFILARLGGATLVWFAFPLAEIGAFIVCALLLLRTYRKEIRNL